MHQPFGASMPNDLGTAFNCGGFCLHSGVLLSSPPRQQLPKFVTAMWTGGLLGYGLRAAAIIGYTVAASTWALLLPRRTAYRRLLEVVPGWAQTMLRLCGVCLQREGGESLRSDEPVIYVSNHSSLLDIPVLVAALPHQLCFLYKKGLERIPFFGWALRRMPYVPITRRALDAYRHIELARQRVCSYGLSPVVFAEGGRSPDGSVGPFRRGALLLAQSLSLPVVPVAIAGTHALLPPQTLRFRPGIVSVRIGAPLEVPPDLDRRAQEEWLQQLRERIAQWVAEMSSHAYSHRWTRVPLWNASPS